MPAAGSRLKSYRLGHRAEIMAALFLKVKGYRILKRRYKTPVGEVDLIAKKGANLVFVEVKARKNLRDGLEAITPAAQRRISRAAEYFLMSESENFPQALSSQHMRFDAIIYWNWRLRHLTNIF